MSSKVFDKDELDDMNYNELLKERGETRRGIEKHIKMLGKFGGTDKFSNERNKHINLLYKKKHYIEKRLKELRK